MVFINTIFFKRLFLDFKTCLAGIFASILYSNPFQLMFLSLFIIGNQFSPITTASGKQCQQCQHFVKGGSGQSTGSIKISLFTLIGF
jgi:hypothetical protein